MASEMFWKNQVDVSITFFTYIHHILAVDEFVAIAFVYSTVEEQREQTTTELLRRNLSKSCFHTMPTPWVVRALRR